MANTDTPPMLAGVYDDPNLAPFLNSQGSGEGSGDASMEQRPMSGSASGPMKPSVEPAQTDTKGLGMTGRTPEAMAPQVGPPPAGKEEFHNMMSDFGHRAEANRAAVIGLNPSDSDYLKKLEALQAQHGAITQEKARYQMLHPWGGPESAHPGMLGKIGHVAGEFGNVVGDAVLGKGNMAEIPGSSANLEAKSAGGGAEQAAAIGEEAKTGSTEAKETAAGAKADVADSTIGLNTAKADVLKNPPLKTMQQELAAATQDAQTRGIDPMADPKVQQLTNVIKETQKQAQESIDKKYNEAVENGDHEEAARLLRVKSDLAKAGQAPQRAPMTEVVLPGGQLEVARPGMTLPEGTQNIGGFATMNRPTAQQRNVQAQAGIAAQGIPEVVSEIDQLKDQLGPVAGRWNEFMQGRVGMENPAFAGLRADLLMVSSAVALAHARGRLPENLREEFDQAINAPKQDPENLKNVLNHILPWMQRMEKMTDQPSNPTAGGGATPPKGVPSFADWLASQKKPGAANAAH